MIVARVVLFVIKDILSLMEVFVLKARVSVFVMFFYISQTIYLPYIQYGYNYVSSIGCQFTQCQGEKACDVTGLRQVYVI